MSTTEEDTLKSINLKTLLTLLTLFGILATTAGAWFVQSHRVEVLEATVAKHEEILDSPRYTLADDQRRMESFSATFSKELDRRGNWMEGHDKFRLETVKTTADTSANIREIKSLIISMKTDIESIKKKE